MQILGYHNNTIIMAHLFNHIHVGHFLLYSAVAISAINNENLSGAFPVVPACHFLLKLIFAEHLFRNPKSVKLDLFKVVY